ncbi:hypothetical protein EJB05_31842, partial [Eragrostis curvula]
MDAAEKTSVDESQISPMFDVSRFHCRACLGALKPPTFTCEGGHLVCGTCLDDHAQVCTGADVYIACSDEHFIVRDANLPCFFSEFGCNSRSVTYKAAADHERACQWAPCYCPALGCEAFTSPARLVDHFRAAHAWPVTEVSHGKPSQLAMPPVGPLRDGVHVLVTKEEQSVFLVSASASPFGAATEVSLVCVRANGDPAPGVPQFKCRLWVESPRAGVDPASVTFPVESKDMSGWSVAAKHGSFLTVTPDLLRGASGDTPVLINVRIDRIGGGSSCCFY